MLLDVQEHLADALVGDRARPALRRRWRRRRRGRPHLLRARRGRPTDRVPLVGAYAAHTLDVVGVVDLDADALVCRAFEPEEDFGPGFTDRNLQASRLKRPCARHILEDDANRIAVGDSKREVYGPGRREAEAGGRLLGKADPEAKSVKPQHVGLGVHVDGVLGVPALLGALPCHREDGDDALLRAVASVDERGPWVSGCKDGRVVPEEQVTGQPFVAERRDRYVDHSRLGARMASDNLVPPW